MHHIHFYHGWWHRTLKNRTHYSCTANFQQLYQQGSDDCGEGIWTPQRKMALFDEKVQLQHQQYQHCNLSLLRASQFLWGEQRSCDCTDVQEDNNEVKECDYFCRTTTSDPERDALCSYFASLWCYLITYIIEYWKVYLVMQGIKFDMTVNGVCIIVCSMSYSI